MLSQQGSPVSSQPTVSKIVPTQSPYPKWLAYELGKLIEELPLDDYKKHCLSARWLDQVIWMERRALLTRNLYWVFRLTTIIGSLLVPTLVGLFVLTELFTVLHWAVVTLSLLVAITSAVEGFFHFGERWRHYRAIVEMLKLRGWQYLQLAGPFSKKKHDEAFEDFTSEVESLLQKDVSQYLSLLAKEREEERHKIVMP